MAEAMVKGDQKGITFHLGGLNYRLIPVTEEIIRCIISKKEICEQPDSLIIEKKEYAPVEFEVKEQEGSVLLKTEKVQVQVNLQNGRFTWLRPDGSEWLVEEGRDLTEIDVIQIGRAHV